MRPPVTTTRAVNNDCSVTVTFSTPSDAAYCQNIPAGLENVVSCSPSLNFDTFWLHEASFPRIAGGLDIPPGKILSIPFKTRQSEADTGIFNLTTNTTTLNSSEFYFHTWISSAPTLRVGGKCGTMAQGAPSYSGHRFRSISMGRVLFRTNRAGAS